MKTFSFTRLNSGAIACMLVMAAVVTGLTRNEPTSGASLLGDRFTHVILADASMAAPAPDVLATELAASVTILTVSRSGHRMSVRLQPPVPTKRYKVQGGDTLSGIAFDNDMASWQPLAAANVDQVKNPDLIYIGQTLRVPSAALAPVIKRSAHAKTVHISPLVKENKTFKPNYVAGDARSTARQLLSSRGWSGQWGCLNSLINRESGWQVHATNSGSGAYGIPQSLPGSKMATMGSDWRDSATTQLRWMMDYITARYGSPCGAWAHSQATGWY